MADKFPEVVKIVEVGPRDGLQNETKLIPTDQKIEFINHLSNTGLKAIEVTSFVSKKRIPQLADAALVFQNIIKKPNVDYLALVPNNIGLEAALRVGVTHIAIFCAASDTFSMKNTHCTIDESFERIKEILTLTKQKNITVRGYISCVLGCPYEGDIKVEKVAAIAKTLFELGCDEISLGDTIGVGTPKKAKTLISAVAMNVPISKLAVHFHDTYGQALANIYACLSLGISTIDSAIAGLGGCPYAVGASGNVATEDVVYLLNGLGIKTGVDLNALLEVSHFVSKMIGRAPSSKVAQAMIQAKKQGAKSPSSQKNL